MSQPPILIVEDTPSLGLFYKSTLSQHGHEVALAPTVAEGMAAFREHGPKVVLMDLRLPDGCGLELMGRMLAICPETRVIVVTADGTIAKAVEAMRRGAHEFLVKPFDEKRLTQAVRNALLSRRLARDTPPPDLPDGAPPEPFIGSSPAMQQVYGRIRSVARSMASVFITGESGTGKELCAQAVHSASPRANGPFIALNCGAIPADLMESEVFGHLKGSFTGAIADKQGAAAAAHGGTLFLDEICEMDMALQTKLLRFLQTATIKPVGATRPRDVDVRILCATNRDPQEAVRQGRFREDLYYRLHVVPIHMPPLRARGDDMLEIARTALAHCAREEGKSFTGLDDNVKDIFLRYLWPGNVRELLNAVRNVVVLNDGKRVTRSMLPTDIYRASEGETDAGGAARGQIAPTDRPARAATPTGPWNAEPWNPGTWTAALEPLVGLPLARVEQLLIEETIARCGGSVPSAARLLDVAPSTIYRKREAWAQALAAKHGGTAAE